MTLRPATSLSGTAASLAIPSSNGSTFVSLKKNGSHTTISCSGLLDVAAQQRIREAIDLALSSKPETIILDLSRFHDLPERSWAMLSAMVADCLDKGSAVEIVTNGSSMANITGQS